MVILRVRLLKSFREKTQGLLGTQKASPVLFYTRWGIHTIGMKFSIDVLILDKNNKVVKLAKDLPPYEIFIWSPLYNSVIELTAGKINRYKISVGDIVRIQIIK